MSLGDSARTARTEFDSPLLGNTSKQGFGLLYESSNISGIAHSIQLL